MANCNTTLQQSSDGGGHRSLVVCAGNQWHAVTYTPLTHPGELHQAHGMTGFHVTASGGEERGEEGRRGGGKEGRRGEKRGGEGRRGEKRGGEGEGERGREQGKGEGREKRGTMDGG